MFLQGHLPVSSPNGVLAKTGQTLDSSNIFAHSALTSVLLSEQLKPFPDLAQCSLYVCSLL